MQLRLDLDILRILTMVVVLLCEFLRFRWFRSLNLGFQGRGGQRYIYYVAYIALTMIVSILISLFLPVLTDWLWRLILGLPSPLVIYVVALVALLLFYLLLRLLLRMGHGKLSGSMLLAALLGAFCFLFQPLQFVFCGVLLFLGTIVIGRVLGQPVEFLSWDELLAWSERAGSAAAGGAEAGGAAAGSAAAGGAPPAGGVRVRLFLEAEGTLAPRGGLVEMRGEELAGEDADPTALLSRRLLDRLRLAEIVAAQEQIAQQKDLLQEIPRHVAQSLGKLAARHEAINQSGASPAEKDELLEGAVREVLEQAVGARLRSLLYWGLDIPRKRVSFYLNRVAQAELKPILSLWQYLAIPLTWFERRSGGPARA